MSSQSHRKMSGMPSAKPRTDEIELTERFSEQMAQLCMNDNYSDVTFIVEGDRLPAHRVILAARSEYFRAMLFGELSESKQTEIELKIPLAAFKALLKYIYSGHMPLSQMTEDNILDTLGLANQYGLIELELAISEYLRQYLALDNACAILDAAYLYSLDTLITVCLRFIDRHAAEILAHESFKELSKDSLVTILRRDSFFAPEIQIFFAVSEWCKYYTDIPINDVVSYVRLPLISLEHLLQDVRPSGILSADTLLDAITEQATSKTLQYRAALWPEENVATLKHRARVIQGECRMALLDGDVQSYDMEKGYTRHCITDTNDSGIVVELGTICIINYIKMLLWDCDNRSYSYYVEVSVNQKHWERVIDYTQYYCRSWQFLYFPDRPVRYIKLVGTFNSVNKVFHVVGLEAMYTAQMPQLHQGIVAPTYNVATVERSALVSDGVSRERNALVNGDFINYDWDSGYTCHQLGSGEIVIRLGQPYYICTMRLLLWDCDDRAYSYYIESSVNQKDWTMLVDRRKEQCKSWQNFVFKPRPIVFIKIVGTRNTANEIFHCVHLEVPSQEPSLVQAMEKARQNREDITGTYDQLRIALSGSNGSLSSASEAGSDAAAANDVGADNSNKNGNCPEDPNPSPREIRAAPLAEEILINLDNNSMDED